MRFLVFYLLSVQYFFAQQKVQVDTILMGSEFRFVVYDKDEQKAKRSILKGIEEVVRIENLLSEWRDYTPVSKINQLAGKKPMKVDEELFFLLKKSKEFSEKTNGLFDISYAGMERIWKYDGTMTEVPNQEVVKKALEGVGYQYIMLNEETKEVFLSHAKTRISFGSIGKAYAAEKAAQVMKDQGKVQDLMVDASGDIFVYGTPPNKECWEIGIYQPFKVRKYKKICFKNEAIVTSGDYEKFALIGGKRYGHIINPKTGFPATEFSSVSVRGKNAMVANFLSTTLMLMNKKERKNLLKAYPNYQIWLQKSPKK